MGYETEERRIAIQEIFDAAHSGKLDEAFGTGTAAVVSPVGALCWKDEKLVINRGEIGPIAQKLYDTRTGIQFGEAEDPFGWVLKID